MALEDLSRRLDDGLDVHLDRYAGGNDAPLTVVVLHGGGGYGRLLAPFGRVLHEATGADVVLPDLPGYGLTPAPRGLTYGDWVRCAHDLVVAERERTGGRRPVAVFGMSMGGMLGLHAALAGAPVAAVGATTLMDPRRPGVRRGVGRFPLPGALLRSAALDRLPVPMPLTAPIERMSSSRAINRLCLRDPQGGGNTVAFGFLRSWLTYVPDVEPEAFDGCPVLLAHPAADRWTPPAWSDDTLARLAGPTKRVDLPACEHLPMEEPGLTVLREALVDWCAAIAAGPTVLERRWRQTPARSPSSP